MLVEHKTEYHLPRFDTPGGEALETYLRELVDAGARERYGDPVPAEVRERIDHELGVIIQMGFAGYFLIVWDLIRFAREQGIRVGPGRGSAAGSVVSYALRITDLDPLRYGLLFERFLNPERIQMPDIDMDFDERRRDEVIRYATERYGSDHVAQIVTFQTIKGKQGIRDAARVLGFPAVVRRPALQDVPAGGDGARRADRQGARDQPRAPRRVREGARGHARSSTRRARSRGSAARTRSTPPAS